MHPAAPHSHLVPAARLYHHTSGESASWTSAAPEVGVAVKRQRAHVTLDAPVAVAEAELGPNAWADVSSGAGSGTGDGEGEGEGEGEGPAGKAEWLTG